MPDALAELAAKIDLINSRDEIRQLAFKYAVAVDMRDLDAIVNLYVETVKVSKTVSGRQALKRSFDTVLRTFTASVHHVGPHLIEFDDSDNAHGICYCRCEHEVGDKWAPMYLYYLDIYQRIEGRWYFKRRAPSELYVAAIDEHPTGPNKIRWPGQEPRSGTWHEHFPSWDAFWQQPGCGLSPVQPAAEPEKFIDTMRKGERSVIPPDYSWAEKP